MRDHPDLASCAVHCRHCGIRFLTHPRNANRRDLRCPFGCREHHRRQQANERSQRHYRTDQGRRNKKRFNGKRSAAGGSPPAGPRPEPVSTAERVSASDASSSLGQQTIAQSRDMGIEPAARDDVTLALDGFALDEVTVVHSSMLPYLAMVASLLEGHAIEVEDLLQALRRSMRQRRFDRLPRREYVLGFLDQHPP